MLKIEYRVRPVTRYIVTRFHSDYAISVSDEGTAFATNCGTAGSECCGEFNRQDAAEKVAHALANAESDGFVSVEGYPIERCSTALQKEELPA